MFLLNILVKSNFLKVIYFSAIFESHFNPKRPSLLLTNMLHTQNVLVPQQHSVVDFSLSEPGLLISGGEDFHSDTLALPLTPPHFTITALTWTTARGEEFKELIK